MNPLKLEQLMDDILQCEPTFNKKIIQLKNQLISWDQLSKEDKYKPAQLEFLLFNLRTYKECIITSHKIIIDKKRNIFVDDFMYQLTKTIQLIQQWI